MKGDIIEFKLTKPSQFVVEVNGYHHALHVFANSIEDYNIDKEAPNVQYFGPVFMVLRYDLILRVTKRFILMVAL